MIDRELKRVLGQMTYGAYVVSARFGDVTRAYTATWVYQVSFEDPIVAISISPKHDTFELIDQAGWCTVSILAGDQIEQAQYFSYPGRRFRHIGDYLDETDGQPFLRDCIGWYRAVVEDRKDMGDHTLLFARIDEVHEVRLEQPGLTYSSRKGWRIADTPAREPGVSVRDKLLAMLEDQ